MAGDTINIDVFVHDLRTGETRRVSVASGGGQANSVSVQPKLSASGRYVAFESGASNLVAGDTNHNWDVFVHDRRSGRTRRVSVASDGAQAIGGSEDPALSASGRYIAFWSTASNLVPGDTNAWADVFVHDRRTGQTRRVSVASDGAQGNDWSWYPALSASGRYVAFMSTASNLVANDTNAGEGPPHVPTSDVFVHDLRTGETRRASVANDGAEARYGSSESPALSASGRYVAFASAAGNLVAGDTNHEPDIFVHDRRR